MDIDTKINSYIAKHQHFSEMLVSLRQIVKRYPFEETVKWGMPMYMYNNRNLVGMGAFKNHAGLWFMQGALLKDPTHVLINAQQGKTKAMRQIQFREMNDIDEVLLDSFLLQTIDNQKKGLEIKIDRTKKEVILPEELLACLESDALLKHQFYKLTPGRQQEYGNYISEAKRAQTKMDRLEKISPLILTGAGLYDKYKNC